MTDERFLRQEALLGEAAMTLLQASHVAVFGLGGVGSWALEALARAGIGTFTVVDFDTVSRTNINRQLLATESAVGQYKAELAARRVLDINPQAVVHVRRERYSSETRTALLSSDFDFLVDAIDLVSCKLDLIQSAQGMGIPIVSCLGTGNRLRGGDFQITDLAKTRDDPLARVVRKELRARNILHLPVLWAPGAAEKPADLGEAAPQGRRSIPGSISWVPASAGLRLAEYVVLQLLEQRSRFLVPQA